jgi:hypothetical protein
VPSTISKPIDRRFQIFVSSTFRDLREERKKAVEVIFERGHIPIALERFSAANESDRKVIEKAIEDCQIYLLVLGHRYGELVPDNEISYTELEYNIATAKGLHTLVLLMEPEEIKRRRKELDADNDRDRAEMQNFERLQKFHRRVREHFVELWTPEDFKFLVLKALDDNLPRCDKRGFVREPEDPTFLESAENPFIVDIVGKLKGFGKLYERCLKEAQKKHALAAYFKEQYLNAILKHKVSLFFESGSTVAYVAKYLAEPLYREVRLEGRGEPSIKVSTNNVLAYLLLWLSARVPCSPFPWSTPGEETYGAWYGGLEDRVTKNPDYTLPPLDGEAEEEIGKLLSHPFRPSDTTGPALLLGAASGLQIGGTHRLKFRADLDDTTKRELTAQLAGCFGPHVGSYHNKIFKRFMYATQIPIVLFIAADKIDCEIEVGKCHFILDREFDWQAFHMRHPVAFCIGCDQEEKRRFAPIFRQLGFEIWDGPGGNNITAFLARNQAFIDRFERAVFPSKAVAGTGAGNRAFP